MAFINRAKQSAGQAAERAKKYAGANKDKLSRAVVKAETAADARTGGKHRDKIAAAASKVSAYVDRLPAPPAGP